MALNKGQVSAIKDLLRRKLKAKLENYERETASMPFLAKLMQDSEKVAAYSFIHSLATTLGMSVYEQVSKIIALPFYDTVEIAYDVEGFISDEQNVAISKIIQELENGTRKANKSKEMKEILDCSPKEDRHMRIRCDLFLKKGKDEYYIEIKTAKPNIDVFTASKRKLLELIALRKNKIHGIIGIPYNPYHPEPYSRFTIQGILDEQNELYVAERYWELLGGKDTYKELLRIFDDVGKEFKEAIQKKIKEVAKEKMKL